MAGGADAANPDAASEIGGHHHRARRDRSNGSHYSRNSSQERNEGRRRNTQRKDSSGPGQSASGYRGPHGGGSGAINSRGRGGKREGGEYNQRGFFFPSMHKPLVSLQQFSSMQNRSSDPYDIRRQYKIYCEDHRRDHASAFWKEHEKEPWFMETYNPMTVYQAKIDKLDLVRNKAKKFFANIPFDLLDLTKREDGLAEGPQLHRFDPNSRTIYLKQIPVFVARVMLKEAVSSVTTGLEQIILSRPLQMHNFERFAWLVYNTEEQSEAAMPDLETLVIRAPQEGQEDFKLSPIRNNQSVKPPKVTPEMPFDHVARDIDLCKRLIKEVFDAEKDIEFPFEKLETEVDSEDAKLDTLVLYLRQVHGYCFFSGIKSDDERQLAGKTASQYLRLPPSIDRLIFDSSALYGSARQFEHNYVAQAEKYLANGPEEKPGDPQEDDILVEIKNQYCLTKTKEVVEGKKYTCRVCDKAFKSTDFVVKHIKNKHEDRLVRQNYSFFKKEARENFLKQLQKTPEFQQQQSTFAQRDNNSGFNRQGSYGGGSFGGNRGGDYQEGLRGGRGGHGDFGGRGSDRPPYQRNRGGGAPGAFMGNQQTPQAAMEDASGFEGGDKKRQQFLKAYIDYDDPMQFDGQGQKLAGNQTQLQQQIQQQTQISLYKQGGSAAAAGGQAASDRQLVSYDDLF